MGLFRMPIPQTCTLGIKLLFDEGLIWKFVDKTKSKADIEDDKSEDKLKKEFSELDILKTAIFNHSAYRIEEGLPEKVQMFLQYYKGC